MIGASPAKCKVHEIPEEYIAGPLDGTHRPEGAFCKNRIADRRGMVVMTPDCQ